MSFFSQGNEPGEQIEVERQQRAAAQARQARIAQAREAQAERAATAKAAQQQAATSRAIMAGRSEAIGQSLQQNANAVPSQETRDIAARLAQPTPTPAPQPAPAGLLFPSNRLQEENPEVQYEVSVGGVTKTFGSPEERDAYINQIQGQYIHGQELIAKNEFGSGALEDGSNLVASDIRNRPIRHATERGPPSTFKEFQRSESPAQPTQTSESTSGGGGIFGDLSQIGKDFTGTIDTGINDLKSVIGSTSSSKTVTNQTPIPQPTGAINPSGALIKTNPNKTYSIVTVTTTTPSGKNEIKEYYFTDPAKAQAYQDALQKYSSENIGYTVTTKGTGALGDIETGLHEVGNLLTESSQGYQQESESLTAQGLKNNANKRNIVGDIEIFGGGLAGEGAGFTSLLGSTFGRPNPKLKQNVATVAGEALGVGAEAVIGGEVVGGASDLLGVGRGATGIARIAGIGGRAGVFGAVNAVGTALGGGSRIQVGESFALGFGLSSGAEIGGDLFQRVPGVGSIRYKTANPLVKGVAQVKNIPSRIGDIEVGGGRSLGDIFSTRGSLSFVSGKTPQIANQETDEGFIQRLRNYFSGKKLTPSAGDVYLEGELINAPETFTESGPSKLASRYIKNPNAAESIVPVEKGVVKTDLFQDVEAHGGEPTPPKISRSGATDEFGNPVRNPQGQLTRAKPRFNPPDYVSDLPGAHSTDESIGDIFEILSGDSKFGPSQEDLFPQGKNIRGRSSNKPIYEKAPEFGGSDEDVTGIKIRKGFSKTGGKSSGKISKGSGGYGSRQAFSENQMAPTDQAYDFQEAYNQNPIVSRFERGSEATFGKGAKKGLGGDFGYNYRPVVPLIGGQIPTIIGGRNVTGQGGSTLGGKVTVGRRRSSRAVSSGVNVGVTPSIDLGVDVSNIGAVDSGTQLINQQQTGQTTQQVQKTDQITQTQQVTGTDQTVAQQQAEESTLDLDEPFISLSSGSSRSYYSGSGQRRKKRYRYRELKNPVGASNVIGDIDIGIKLSKPKKSPPSKKPKAKKKFRTKELTNPINVGNIFGF